MTFERTPKGKGIKGKGVVKIEICGGTDYFLVVV